MGSRPVQDIFDGVYPPFETRHTGNSLTIECGSELRFLDDIYRETDRFLRALELEAPGLLIVLRELLRNAIIHGNGANPFQTVSCDIYWDGEATVRVTVCDQGSGFDYQNLNYILPEDPRQVDMRGYRLIHAYAQSLTIEDNGRSVTVTLKANPIVR